MTAGPSPAGPFPGGTALTDLAVYDWTGPDGLTGGSAHVHLTCTEGYVVISGNGRLQTLSACGFAEIPLTEMTVAWFSPGVVHRIINDGDLRILVVMQNAGLPEAGDSVLSFPPRYLAEPGTYRATASLGPDPAQAAQRRAYLSVQGFLELRDHMRKHGPGVLDAFYAAAAALVRDRVPGWRSAWAHGPLAAAQRTGDQFDLLEQGSTDYLRRGRLTAVAPPPERAYGMCGRLLTFPSESR